MIGRRALLGMAAGTAAGSSLGGIGRMLGRRQESAAAVTPGVRTFHLETRAVSCHKPMHMDDGMISLVKVR